MEFSYMNSNVPEDSCTAIAVGISAAAEGEGPMTTHNMDCLDCDFRINKVPAADWPKGSERPLYLIRDEYPQLVTNNRGETWDINNLEGTKEQLAAWTDANWQNITGYIPQVRPMASSHLTVFICILHVRIFP